jgi:hypothetical protein
MFEVVYAILSLVSSGLYTSSLMLCSHKHVPYTCSSSAVDSKGQCTSRKRHKDLTYASRVMHSQVDQQTERLNHLEMHRHMSSTSRSSEAGETRSTRRRGEAMNLMFYSRRGPHRPNRDLENTSIRICRVLSWGLEVGMHAAIVSVGRRHDAGRHKEDKRANENVIACRGGLPSLFQAPMSSHWFPLSLAAEHAAVALETFLYSSNEAA